jgi:hypothetical protein
MSQNDGGPAFPTLGDEFMQTPNGSWCPKSDYGFHGDPGMSLRDWFAGQALAGMANEDVTDETVANWAYLRAEAMLRERERRIKQD